MSEKTIDIFMIQPPTKCVSADDKDNCEGYLSGLLTYYQFSGAITVRDIHDFINRIIAKVAASGGAKIKNLVIGSHGTGGTYAFFRIGNDYIDNVARVEINSLRALAPYFAKDADVFILACHTGSNEHLLQKVSTALGGVRVHGYTGSIKTDGDTLDIGTDAYVGSRDGAKQIVCLYGECTNTDQRFPEREESPFLKNGNHGRF